MKSSLLLTMLLISSMTVTSCGSKSAGLDLIENSSERESNTNSVSTNQVWPTAEYSAILDEAQSATQVSWKDFYNRTEEEITKNKFEELGKRSRSIFVPITGNNVYLNPMNSNNEVLKSHSTVVLLDGNAEEGLSLQLFKKERTNYKSTNEVYKIGFSPIHDLFSEFELLKVGGADDTYKDDKKLKYFVNKDNTVFYYVRQIDRGPLYTMYDSTTIVFKWDLKNYSITKADYSWSEKQQTLIPRITCEVVTNFTQKTDLAKLRDDLLSVNFYGDNGLEKNVNIVERFNLDLP